VYACNEFHSRPILCLQLPRAAVIRTIFTFTAQLLPCDGSAATAIRVMNVRERRFEIHAVISCVRSRVENVTTYGQLLSFGSDCKQFNYEYKEILVTAVIPCLVISHLFVKRTVTFYQKPNLILNLREHGMKPNFEEVWGLSETLQ